MNIINYRNPGLNAWSSFDQLSSLRDLLDSAFQLANTPRSQSWAPPLDVFEDEQNVTVHFDLPGMKKDDLNISLEDEALTVSGERKSEHASESFRKERSVGSFSRSITLPAPVRGADVSASYQDGVLTVTLPKAEEAKPRKIQVQ